MLYCVVRFKAHGFRKKAIGLPPSPTIHLRMPLMLLPILRIQQSQSVNSIAEDCTALLESVCRIKFRPSQLNQSPLHWQLEDLWDLE